jgi:hypothetical protein
MPKVIKPRDTLGGIAKEYGYSVVVFWALIKPYTDLFKELDNYLDGIEKKGQKKLPPIIVDKIFTTLGEPN